MTRRSSLTVLFQEPFWVGIYERTDEEGYQACRVVFGAEPRDCEVYEFLLENWRTLTFSPAAKAGPDGREERRRNPKRTQREIRRRLEEGRGVGTKAQQALSLQREACRTEARLRTREAREAEEARRYELRREKKREKHRGR